MARDDIVVLGAGIIGLNVALELSKRGYGQHITVLAEHLPGDESIQYTSPWAGANFSGISGNDANALRWDQLGYSTMMSLIDAGAEVAKYLSKTESTEYWDQTPSQDKVQSMKGYLRDLVIVPSSELPEGVSFGIRFTTVTVNAPDHCKHLRNLLSQPRYGNVQFIRRKVAKIQDAFLSNTRVVFNCIGNAASVLPGVTDTKCYPTRGQIVLAKAPSMRVNMMRHGTDYETYIIPRPDSEGTVILGGYLQPRDYTSHTRPEETQSILKRTTDLLPTLNNGDTKILRVAVGLRPSRNGGARVELEPASHGRAIVHNYGAGGTGFQAGMGMAHDAVDLAGDILKTFENKRSSLHGLSLRIDDEMFRFGLDRGYEDPHPSVPDGGADHAIMDELVLSIYDGQGFAQQPLPSQTSLDNHASMASQLCGLTGDMDPYVLRHYRFDARSELTFSKLAIRTVQGTGIPVQFLLSKTDMSNEPKTFDGEENQGPAEDSPKLSHIVGLEIGTRLIHL
ncbi:hypothetical protein BBP40_002567 [Aspergillus hancockii]|nr:hypothetical protein BBP40_002567 [Aspergillus hancockii]